MPDSTHKPADATWYSVLPPTKPCDAHRTARAMSLVVLVLVDDLAHKGRPPGDEGNYERDNNGNVGQSVIDVDSARVSETLVPIAPQSNEQLAGRRASWPGSASSEERLHAHSDDIKSLRAMSARHSLLCSGASKFPPGFMRILCISSS